KFWSTARIKTMDEGTKILATVDGKPRTISESSIRRNLKLKDEAGISSLLDAELFENLTLMGYNILPNQKFSFQKGQFSHQWKYLIHTIMQCLSPNSNGFNEFSINIATAFVQYTRRARIAQSSALPPIADELASPIGDDSQGEACPTDSGLEAEQDRANIIKTSTLPSDSTPKVTSLVADEGSMQQKLNELMDLCTRLQRQQDEMASKINAQDLEISTLKARIKHLEDRDGGDDDPSGEYVTIKGRSVETGEEAKVATVSLPPAGEILTISVSTGSGVVPTASPIFTTATVTTPTQEGKEYHQFAAEMPIEERIELINDLVKYQDNYAKVLKDVTGRNQREVCSSLEADRRFVPMGSREEGERFKRKGLRLEQEIVKKVKTSEEVSEEDLKEMMYLVPVEEVYVEALQVKHLIIDWEIHSEGQRTYWKIIRLGGSTTSYQFLQAPSDKKKEVWVELKKLYEPDVEDQLWTYTQALMHDPVEWRLYDICGVHHILSRDQEIFMLVEREYLLRKGHIIVMISNKLQVENYSQMDSDLI
nr:hypothetical protein [Tanacetum cinerariifolium]GEX46342.1 hypothetical protein [Tanacetum cinerariifolium]